MHNLQINLASKAKGGDSSKPGSQQSTARNIPKGSITFHNKQNDSSNSHSNTTKEYDSKNSKNKRKKEHPTFFEVKPSQITLDKN
mmetsp:Transcript_45563/g.60455  ORF Transcript_45563/g.60455 Transcript_45563/m.60455 type:complete len:85 (-) Transcript_45563:1862-2116(-)